MVVHNSFKEGKVVISTYEDYAEGHDIVESTRYTPHVLAHQMEANARRLLGKPWRPWYNCQHFITEIAGLKPHSWQMDGITASIVICSIVVLATKA